MTEFEIGSGQMKVLRILWRKKRATAQDIIDELNEYEIVRRSTVQTFLRVLVKKGIIDYDTEDRTFVYYPLIEEEEIAKHAFQGFVDHVFNGSMEGFLSFFAKNRYIPPEKSEKLRRLLENGEDKK
ncbi:MAG: BlaI/MecI/CopY family transcriptional regulator [Candidatus Latescibacteria bacterium]|nr:BlaI/MecI/CopY family transcriptional regulator [Candidatus Latescibacterota bacterium]